MNSTMHPKFFAFLMITATTSILLPSAAKPKTPADYGFTQDQIKASKTKNESVVVFSAVQQAIDAANAKRVEAETNLRSAQATLKETQDQLTASQRDQNALTDAVNDLQKHLATMTRLAKEQRAVDVAIIEALRSKKATPTP